MNPEMIVSLKVAFILGHLLDYVSTQLHLRIESSWTDYSASLEAAMNGKYDRITSFPRE